jgi:hypothetical protein
VRIDFKRGDSASGAAVEIPHLVDGIEKAAVRMSGYPAGLGRFSKAAATQRAMLGFEAINAESDVDWIRPVGAAVRAHVEACRSN